MSLGARLVIALFAFLFGAVMCLVAPPTDKAPWFYGFGIFCFLIGIASVTKRRVARFCGSLVASVVVLAGLLYLGSEIHSWIVAPANPALAPIAKAGMFLVFFGLPAAAHVRGARFGFGPQQPEPDEGMFEKSVTVVTDSAGISVSVPDGKNQHLRWGDVERIAIETNDSGPWGADVWWLIEGTKSSCAYPQGATGDQEAMEVLAQRFPGFSDEQVINAMGSTSNARFVCWDKSLAK